MEKVYCVIIKGRTLESRDLKELLARAVLEKRSADRKFQLQDRPYMAAFSSNPSNAHVN